jgi:pimeloyl-ACP methyl ester carboxylesterase
MNSFEPSHSRRVRTAFALVAAAASLALPTCVLAQPASNQPAPNQPASNQPASNQPASNQPASNQPAQAEPVPTTTTATPDPLPRRGAIGLALAPGQDAQEGLGVVSAIRPGGPADRAGIRIGDAIASINGVVVSDTASLQEFLRTTPGTATLDVVVKRDNADVTIAVTLEPFAVESLESSVVTYSSVVGPGGHRLRTIITEPRESSLASGGRAPAFLFVQGIVCQSLDRPQAPGAPDTRLVHAMADRGYVTLRVDKQGLGDSQGPPCGTLDFASELEGYKAALDQLRALPSVDPSRVYVFGHSMGGVMAPFLAQHAPVAGVIVFGTTSRTWFEYQLENVRRQLALAGASPSDIVASVQNEARISSTILIDKGSLANAWEKYPNLREPSPMATGDTLYTRGMSFFHQLQDANVAQAWERSAAPALVVHGGFDWVTSREDHAEIAAIANARAPGSGRLLLLPKSDHAFTTHESLEASLGGMGQGEFDSRLPIAVAAWIAQLEGRTPAGPLFEGEDAALAQRLATTTPAQELDPMDVPAAMNDLATVTPEAPDPNADTRFPLAWLGSWEGEARTTAAAGSQPFTMKLDVARTDDPARFTWTITYDGSQGRSVRPYTLVVRDAVRADYAIDEGNGIVLDAAFLDNAIYSHFLVSGARITSRIRLEGAGTPHEHLAVELITTLDDRGVKTGGGADSRPDVPEVTVWAPVSVQRAALLRVAE